MKYLDGVIKRKLTFDEVNDYIKNHKYAYATRPGYKSIHVYSKKGKYCILLEDETTLIDAIDIVQDKDKNDWMLVTITDEAVAILLERLII
ncbi:MAG TPA: hypothetical protein VK190_02435 [Pseudoneobacillus sp.]|nr:hypothetical protein [Pseudoneobacillus sp.]